MRLSVRMVNPPLAARWRVAAQPTGVHRHDVERLDLRVARNLKCPGDRADDTYGDLVVPDVTNRADLLELLQLDPNRELDHHRPAVEQRTIEAFVSAGVPCVRVVVLDQADVNTVDRLLWHIDCFLQLSDIYMPHRRQFAPWLSPLGYVPAHYAR